MGKLLAIVALASACFTSPASAANIYIAVTAPDQVGKSLAYEIREGIASSRQHRLVNDEGEAAFTLKVVTLNPETREGLVTIYSATLTMSNFDKENPLDYYLTSWVGNCGYNRTAFCARSIISGVDSEVTPIIEAVAKSLKQ